MCIPVAEVASKVSNKQSAVRRDSNAQLAIFHGLSPSSFDLSIQPLLPLKKSLSNALQLMLS